MENADAENHSAQQTADGPSESEPERKGKGGRTQSILEDGARDVPWRSAEGDANAKFARPLGDRIGDCAVDAESREERREGAEPVDEREGETKSPGETWKSENSGNFAAQIGEPARFRKRHGLEQHRIDDAEDGGYRPDPQRQRENRGKGKPGGSEEAAEGLHLGDLRLGG